MTIRSLFLTAAAVGCTLVGTGGISFAQQPTPSSSNQQLAEAVANRLATSGVAQTADIAIAVNDGVVTLTGSASDAAAKDKIIQEVRTIPGVTKIRDGIRSGAAVQQAQATVPSVNGPVAAPVPSGVLPGGMLPGGVASGPVGVPSVEPTPVGMPGMAGADLQSPPLPGHAWPTYAPYNNISRVAYPQAYPYNAFPFIGPFYPFPKVPLGWRKVTLEWEDGHWWIGKTQAPHDYWRVRFW